MHPASRDAMFEKLNKVPSPYEPDAIATPKATGNDRDDSSDEEDWQDAPEESPSLGADGGPSTSKPITRSPEEIEKELKVRILSNTSLPPRLKCVENNVLGLAP